MQEKIIQKLYKLNEKAIKNGDVPVSCIITKNNRIISYGYNKKNKNHDPFGHAEIIAIRKAAKKLKRYNLSDCTLYVTLFPCDMCKSVINECRIKKVFYILNNNKKYNNTIKFSKIKLKNEQVYSDQLTNFFINKR